MYRAWIGHAPDVAKRQSLAKMAEDEAAHARLLDALLGILSLGPPFPAGPEPPGAEPGPSNPARPWAAALMVAFSLDQAATACLSALQRARHSELATVAGSIVADELSHQEFILDTFRALAIDAPAFGDRLAAEMVVARDWVEEVFPRRAELAQLVEKGQLHAKGIDEHDSFLAALTDRLQQTLGVSS
jgi:1,2-phenylacetyl-CoA epoxidase catalytic subunit